MREGPWKVVLQKKKTLLFNLSSDLSEKKNISVKHAARVERMLKANEKWKKDVNASATPQPEANESKKRLSK